MNKNILLLAILIGGVSSAVMFCGVYPWFGMKWALLSSLGAFVLIGRWVQEEYGQKKL
jgi:hypothetical protein